jgi:hypothetical protein
MDQFEIAEQQEERVVLEGSKTREKAFLNPSCVHARLLRASHLMFDNPT